MKKHFLFVISMLFVFVLFSGCTDKKYPNVITVVGVSQKKAVPNTVVMSFAVESLDKDLEKAKKENDEIILRFKKVMDSYKIDAKNIQTDDVNIEPRYKDYYKRTKGGLVGYSVSQNITVTLKDIKKYDVVLKKALKAGVTGVNYISKRIDKRAKIEQEVRGKAVENARKKAEHLSKKAGLNIGKAVYISEDCSMNGNDFVLNYVQEPSRSRVMSVAGGFEALGGDETTYFPGQQVIKSCRKMSFELK